MPRTQEQIGNARAIVAEERAYRRGYHQAVIAILDALESGLGPDLGRYEARVKEWREGPSFPMQPPTVF